MFLQAVLDSSFVALLQHSPSHDLLRSISQKISPQLSLNQVLEQLRGPLLPYTRAHAKARADAKGDWQEKDTEDWRKRRRNMHEQNALNIGPYQVEELVF